MDKPTPIIQPDFTNLSKLCAQWLDEVETGEVGGELRDYIYEAALEAVYGPDVWKWVNAQDYSEF